VPDEKEKKTNLYLVPLQFDSDTLSLSLESTSSLDKLTLLGSIPTTSATNFVYNVKGGYLVFTDYVYPDGKLETVNAQDEEWENRGNTAYVYDTTYERHWDTWVGVKKSSILSVKLDKDPDYNWHLGGEFFNVLRNGEGHVSLCPALFGCLSF
jgi:hypothetical protein